MSLCGVVMHQVGFSVLDVFFSLWGFINDGWSEHCHHTCNLIVSMKEMLHPFLSFNTIRYKKQNFSFHGQLGKGFSLSSVTKKEAALGVVKLFFSV